MTGNTDPFRLTIPITARARLDRTGICAGYDLISPMSARHWHGVDTEFLLAQMPDGSTEEDAEFICQAVNSHAALVAALKSAQSWIREFAGQNPDERIMDLDDEICAALAAIRGK